MFFGEVKLKLLKEIVVEYSVSWDFVDIEVEFIKFYEDLFVSFWIYCLILFLIFLFFLYCLYCVVGFVMINK